jgi:serine/threonine protein phosphatase PrpC
MRMEIEFGAQSDTGCVRENNEDSYRVAPEMNLFVLSDGMGGLESGEVASRLAVDTILERWRETERNSSLPLAGERIEGVSDASNQLASAIRSANEVVYRAAQQGPGQRGMGATIVAVQCIDERMSVAHVGDSRIYRLRGGQLDQLTRDHSFVAEQVRHGKMTEEEAASSTMQNVLVRALGIEPTVEVDVSEELLMENDTVLLCSDGLTRELSDAQIAAVRGESSETQAAARRLVDMAKQAGGGDNVTVIVLRRATKPAGVIARVGSWFKKSA